MVVPAALCATVAVAGWVAGGPAGLDSRTIANAETPIEVIQITTAAVSATPEATTVGTGSGSVALSEPARDKAGDTTGSIGKPDKANDGTPISDSRSIPEPGPRPALLAATSPFDIGQAAVIARHRVLAIEAAEGTDAMLERVAALRAAGRIGLPPGVGVLVKAPKRRQDRRYDLPSIGPDTVARVAAAGLAGIAVVAGAAQLRAGDFVLAHLVGIHVKVHGDQHAG